MSGFLALNVECCVFESNMKSVDNSGDDNGLRSSEFRSSTALVAVIVNRSLSALKTVTPSQAKLNTDFEEQLRHDR